MQKKTQKKWHLTTIKLLLLIIPVLIGMSPALSAGPIIKSGVGIIVNPGHLPTSQCGGNITSCGQSGSCIDLTGLAYCVNGHVVETICDMNNPKNVTRSTSCQLFQSQLNVTNKVGSQRQVNIRFYNPDTTQVVNSFSINGVGQISSLAKGVDFELDYDDANLKFKVKNLDLTKLDSNTGLIIDRLLTTVPNIDVYKAYLVELPSNFTYSSIDLNIKYADTAVRNESNLKLYRCDSFSTSTSSCNVDWVTISTITLDSTNKVVSSNINHFSVYALGEPKNTTTTTTTTTTTSTTTTISESNSNQNSDDNADAYSSYHPSSSYTPSTTILPECIRNKPNLSVDPLSQTGVVGDTLQYNVTIKNMDSVECDGREFEINSELPEGWMMGHDYVGKVEPGETKLINIMVNSPKGAVTNETYQLSAYVLDKDSGEQSNTVYFKYTVNDLPNTEIKASASQTQSSPLTAFSSLIVGNQLMLMLPVAISIIIYIIWRRPVLMIKGLSRSYEQKPYNGGSKPIVVRLEPSIQPKIDTQSQINLLNNGGTVNGGIKPINKTKTVSIEDIRRKALKYDKTSMKKFNY